MRRLLPAAHAALGALGAVAALPGAAWAHPLGNFSLNHLAVVSVARERLEVRYVLDEAEIPTFQERDFAPAAVLARKRAEVARRLTLTVDGRRTPLVFDGPGVLRHRAGQGGLPTTRVVLDLHAAIAARGTAVLHDGTYPGRVGWKAVVPVAGRGTAVRSPVTSDDPTRQLTVYPKALLTTPADVPTATLAFAPGAGTLTAPHAGSGAVTADRSGGSAGFAALFDDAAAGRGVLVFLLVAAFGWGALHALSPGHGKTMVAAYLVGVRGTPRHAVALGATVTVAHTIGVFALGVVTLALSAYVLPEDLYPWLNLASGLLVVGIGAGVLRSRLRHRSAHRHRHHHHHDHGHSHDHDLPDRVTWRGLLGMGASAGLIPCPSALVVLLAAVAQHQIALGLLLIVAFSVGLAGTLTVLGLAVVWARGVTARLSVGGPVVALLPSASAVVILGAGVALTARAMGQF
jgi:nickel/cobalt transporter (NicO) family protein